MIRLTRDCQLDLQWWLDFLPNSITGICGCDASGKQGFGVYINSTWFYRAWLPIQQPLWAYKEVFLLVLACRILGQSWANKRIKFWCDNQSVVHIWHFQRRKDHAFGSYAKFNFRVSSEHLPGKTNKIADSLSRFNLQEFFSPCPRRCGPTRELASASDLQSLTDFTILVYRISLVYCTMVWLNLHVKPIQRLSDGFWSVENNNIL